MAVPGKKAQYEVASTLSRGSSEEYVLFCQLCDRDDIRVPAFGFCKDCEEHLCEWCFNHHKRAKPSRHHILLDKHNMPKTLQVSSKSVNDGQSDDLTKPCSKHTHEIIKYYCQDHKAFLCSACVTLDHPRTSCHVNYIPDISKHCLNSNTFIEMLRGLDTIIERYKKAIAVLKEKVTKSYKSLMDVLADIKKFRKDINQRLDELENEAGHKAKAIQEEHFTRLKTAETTCDGVIKSMKASSDSLKQLNKSKQADKLFVELKTAETLIKNNEKLSKQLSSEGLKEYRFQPNPELASTLHRGQSLGTLTIKSSKSRLDSAADVRLLQFTHQVDICVKSSKDRKTCDISGMALLTPSRLILTDMSNTSVKMVDLGKNTIVDQLKLDHPPYDITSVTTELVAVTLPAMETIQFITAALTKLSLKRRLKLTGNCYGIGSYQNKLIVTFQFPAKLQIIDSRGRILKTVPTDLSYKDIFNDPRYVTPNSRSVYVSNEGEHAVIMLNWQGELTGSYGGVGDTAGIAVLEDGSILVSENNKGNIHHISGDLTSGNVVLKDLKDPQAVCWCGTNYKLYISQCNAFSDDMHLNFIQVFKKL